MNRYRSSSEESNKECVRISWFLLEIDEGLNNGESANGQMHYIVVHQMDLVDAASSNMYIDRIVTFARQRIPHQGKLVYASDDRILLERHLNELLKKKNNNKLDQCGRSLTDDGPSTSAAALSSTIEERDYFLIQYTTAINDFVHTIVHKDEIMKPYEELRHKQEVYVREGEAQRLATILYSDSNLQVVEDELMSLKNNVFNVGLDESDTVTQIHGSPWLLVQYSCTTRDVIYSIINFDETVWRETNLYPDVVAYIKNDNVILQCVIVRKSHNRTDLDAILQRMRTHCVNLKYPLRPNLPMQKPTMSSRSKKFNNSQPPIDHQTLCARNPRLVEVPEEETPNAMAVEERLAAMESQMHREASMIAEAFDTIGKTRKALHQRLSEIRNKISMERKK